MKLHVLFNCWIGPRPRASRSQPMESLGVLNSVFLAELSAVSHNEFVQIQPFLGVTASAPASGLAGRGEFPVFGSLAST